MRKTKIVCTIGPASQDPQILKAMIQAGMNVARLNFSHGTHEEHLKVLTTVRNLSKEMNTPIAVLQDLCGPKIRIGSLKSAPVELKNGDNFILTTEEINGDSTKASISYKGLPADIQAGAQILIDDGLIELRAVEIKDTEVRCVVVNGGELNPHKGVNFPGVSLKVPAVTEKDIEDLLFGLEHKVDFVALSFIRESKDLIPIKNMMEEKKTFIPIIVKIEKHEGVKNIDDILQYVDGIMVARGDLGVEIPIEEVPLVQKTLIKKCNILAKPVITATQMLDSMIRNPRPTRAEVTDVANAIFDGTDAIMLSGETASGKFPLEAVKMMAKIAGNTESSLPYEKVLGEKVAGATAIESISLATCEIAEELDAKAILISTSSGRTARSVSKFKPRAPILAATASDESIRRLVLSWGVQPLLVPVPENTDKMMEDATGAALKSGIVKEGDLIIITGGIPAGIHGSTNMIKVHILGKIFLRGTGVGKKAVITGKICTAENPDEAEKKLEEGDILLVKNIDEGWKKVLLKVKGVICRDCTPGSPASKIVEEIGIPAVFGVPSAFEVFKDERIITIDSSRGTISGQDSI